MQQSVVLRQTARPCVCVPLNYHQAILRATQPQPETERPGFTIHSCTLKNKVFVFIAELNLITPILKATHNLLHKSSFIAFKRSVHVKNTTKLSRVCTCVT